MTSGDADHVWQRLDAALRRTETARAAAGAYPRLVALRPVFVDVEQVGSRWRLLARASATPQEARDDLAHRFLVRASQLTEASTGQRAYRHAAEVLDRERHDEMAVAGRRFGIARVEQMLRLAADGTPEPPHAGDWATAGAPAAGRRGERQEFIGDADTDSGARSAELRRELRESRMKAGSGPAGMAGDERRRRPAYPQPVLLGARFMVMDRPGAWLGG